MVQNNEKEHGGMCVGEVFELLSIEIFWETGG